MSLMASALRLGSAARLPPRAGAGLLVVLAHGVLLIALTLWAPNIAHVIEPAPLQVQVLSPLESQPEAPQLPAPQLMSLQPVTLTPPEIEVLVEPAVASNAITLPTPPPTPPASDASAVEAKLVSEVAYVQPPMPRYPPESKRSREQGLVSLRVLIDELGRARDVQVDRSSGFPRLDEAAREAVLRALFKPYIEAGAARPAIVIIPIEFALNTRGASRHSRGG